MVRWVWVTGRKGHRVNGTVLGQYDSEDTFRNKRVLVTGATGFIGSHLCDALIAVGAEVHGVCRQSGEHNYVPNCKLWCVDLTDEASTRATFERLSPQLVYHLAGYVDGRLGIEAVLPSFQANVVGTLHVLLAAFAIRCPRVVVVSSSEELAAIATGGIPNSPYSAAKSAATAYARMFARLYALPAVIVRIFMGYGPRQPLTKVVPYTIATLLAGRRPELTSGRRVLDWIFSSDIVDGLLRVGAAIDLVGEIVDLGTGRGASIRDVVSLLVELTDSSPSLPEYGAIPDRPGECSQVADVDRLRLQLHWQPRWALRDGLAETVEWYRRRGELEPLARAASPTRGTAQRVREER